MAACWPARLVYSRLLIRIQCYNQHPGSYSSLLASSSGKQSPVDQDPVL